MSTASPGATARGGADAIAAPTDAGGRPAPPVDPSSAVAALSVETSAFVDTFDRWSSRKAAEAGASVARLRLLYSVHRHGPQKMADLADQLTVTPRNVTALVDGLEADGLVRRMPHSTDRRVTLVELTCNSERVAAQFGAYQASIAGLFDALTDDEQRTLLRLLAALRERIQAEGSCPAGATRLDDA
jgi:DNA-binding MarR family transcriptional regulator